MANSISHASLPYPIKNARYTMLVPYLDADGDPTDPTTPDTEISQDAGAFADAAEEVTTVSGSNGVGYITLTGAETNNSAVGVAFKVASGPKNTLATLYPKNLAVVGSGTLSAGSAGGGTLGTILAYDVTGCFIRTTGGTGGGGTGGANNQARRIITYTTSTGAFTVSPNWETTPDNTTTYDVLLPEGVTLGMLKALNPTTAGRTLVVDSSGLADANTVKVGPTGSGTAQTAGDIFGAVGALNTSASAGDPGTTTTLVAYLKQIVNTLEGSAGIPTFPSAAVAANAVSLAEIIRSIDTRLPSALGANNNLKADIRDINGTTIAGTGTRVADSFVAMLNVVSPAFTVACVNQTGDSYTIVADSGYGNQEIKRAIDAVDDYVDTEVAAIKAKTDNLPPDPADASDIAASFSTVNSILSAIAGYIDTEVAAIKAKTDQLTFGTTNRVNAQVYGVENSAIGNSAFAPATGLQSIMSGTAVSGGTKYIILDSGASSVDDAYKFQWITITGGTGAGQSRMVESYVGSTRRVNVYDRNWTTQPDNTSTYAIIPAAEVGNAQGIYDAYTADELATTLTAVYGLVDTEVAAIKAVTDQFTAAQAEPTSVPAANATPLQKIAWLAMLARNKITQTATAQIVKADDGTTTVGTSPVSDDGTTFTRGEFS